jgi:hypothetical protein
MNWTPFRLFRPSRLAPEEPDAVSDQFRPSRLAGDAVAASPCRHVHEHWPYVRACTRSTPRPYVCTRPYFLQHGCTYVYTIETGLPELVHRGLYYDTCRSLLGHGSSLQRGRSTTMDVHVLRPDRLCTFRPGGSQLSGRVMRHFRACKDIAYGSQLSGMVIIFFA